MGQALGSALAGTLADRGGLTLAFLVAAATAALGASCGTAGGRGRRRADSVPAAHTA
jgi:hypothetical protein